MDFHFTVLHLEPLGLSRGLEWQGPCRVAEQGIRHLPGWGQDQPGPQALLYPSSRCSYGQIQALQPLLKEVPISRGVGHTRGLSIQC